MKKIKNKNSCLVIVLDQKVVGVESCTALAIRASLIKVSNWAARSSVRGSAKSELARVLLGWLSSGMRMYLH